MVVTEKAAMVADQVTMTADEAALMDRIQAVAVAAAAREIGLTAAAKVAKLVVRRVVAQATKMELPAVMSPGLPSG